jgi:NAD(P)-dependent dehydrogenase (short-subunit alcohol dehydrogenase family)
LPRKYIISTLHWHAFSETQDKLTSGALFLLHSRIVQTGLSASLGSDQLFRDTLVVKTALKRIGEAEDIAKVILFFLSEDSAYITGNVNILKTLNISLRSIFHSY